MVIEIVRNADILQSVQFVGDEFFALDVSAIFDSDFGFLDDFASDFVFADKAVERRDDRPERLEGALLRINTSCSRFPCVKGSEPTEIK